MHLSTVFSYFHPFINVLLLYCLYQTDGVDFLLMLEHKAVDSGEKSLDIATVQCRKMANIYYIYVCLCGKNTTLRIMVKKFSKIPWENEERKRKTF